MIRDHDVGGDTTAKPFTMRLTRNEVFWIETIRMSSQDRDPRPTLARVQQLRRIFERGAVHGDV